MIYVEPLWSIDHELVCYVLEKMLVATSVCKPGEFLDSYLNRKSFAVEIDSETQKLTKIQIVRVYLKKTSPQGSLLSPILWRIYDNLFTELYKENLVAVEMEYEDILVISHVSYADDHITVVSFLIEDDANDEEVAHDMCIYLRLVRSLIVDATVQLGCGVNPTKSENIVPNKYCKYIDLNFENVPVTDENRNNFLGKDTFKWLGYYLTISETNQLDFNQKKIEDHLKYLATCREQVFFYSDSMFIKWRIFKVFFCPFIELYVPLVIQSKTFENTAIHKFQHASICSVLGLPKTACRRNLEVKLGEKSVEEKAIRTTNRLIFGLKLKMPDFESFSSSRTLRNRVIPAYSHNVTDRRDFICRLFLFQNLQTEHTVKIKFETKKIQIMVKNIKKAIKQKITQQNKK